MADVIDSLRAARRGAVLVAAEMWRRAVIDGTASEDDAMEADARLAKVEAELRTAESERHENESRRRRELEQAREAILAELRKGPSPNEASLADAVHYSPAVVGRALHNLMARRKIVRVSGTGAFQLRP